jgi:hypothetical protein
MRASGTNVSMVGGSKDGAMAAGLVLVAVACLGGCDAPSPGPSSAVTTAAPESSAAPRVPTIFQVTYKNHRGVIRLEVGDAFEVPEDTSFTYRVQLQDPSIFRSDSASHFTAIASGASQLLVLADPVCRAPDASACGVSAQRWSVQLLVR